MAVVATGSPCAAGVLYRERIEITDRKMRGAVQPYHHAATLDLSKAPRYLQQIATRSRELAGAAIAKITREFPVESCGMLISSARPARTLEATLASHAAIHSAEGEFFRDAILQALSIPCTKIKEKEVLAQAAAVFRIEDLAKLLGEMRNYLGPPWTQDEKFAALAAWLAVRRQDRA
jgi:hypothetical protein